MAHYCICLYCNQRFDRDNEEYVKPRANRYAHKACAQAIEDQKTQEEKNRDALEIYIKELFGITRLTAKIEKQIKTYREVNNYSYSGMLKSLKYFYEVKNNSIEKANGGIGIIPFVFDQAHQYYFAIWEAQQRNQQVDKDSILLPTREVTIEPPKRQPMRHIRKLFTFLEEEEGN